MLSGIADFLSITGFGRMLEDPSLLQNGVMIAIGLILIGLGIARRWEPLLLIPIGFGMLMGNIPDSGASTQTEGVIRLLDFGVREGIYPALIFLGVGAMTDFSVLLAQPRLILLGAATQVGIFATYAGALQLGFAPAQAGAIGIIGGADGPTTLFVAAQLAPELLSVVAVAARRAVAMRTEILSTSHRS